MSRRIEAAARAMAPSFWGPSVWTFQAHGETPTEARSRVQQQALRDAASTLVAADAEMFNDEAVERVAETIYMTGSMATDKHWEDIGNVRQRWFKSRARAVIAALREQP